MSNIYNCHSENIPYDDISLAVPTGIQGGTYLSKIKINNDDLKLQTETCSTKNGIVKTEKKVYCDLLFTEEDSKFIQIISDIESAIKEVIYEKKDMWFHSEIDEDTIDYHWQPILRKYQGNKYLLRCSIKRPKNQLVKPTVMVYDEKENKLTINDINKDCSLITIIKFNGLKFTTQSFSIDILLEQAMIVTPAETEPKCLIKINRPLKRDESELITSLRPPSKCVTEKINENFEADADTADAANADADAANADADAADAVADAADAVADAADAVADADAAHGEAAYVKEGILNPIDSNNDNPGDEKIASDDKNELKQRNSNLKSIDSLSNLGKKQDKNLKNNDNNIINKTNNEVSINDNDNNTSNAVNVNNNNNTGISINDADNDNLKTIDEVSNTLELDNIEELEDIKELEDLVISSDNDKPLSLKHPSDVYREIYTEVRRKAREARKKAIDAYLEVKRIKSLYRIDDIESSDEENYMSSEN
jgi:hypothetical protein